MRVFLRGALLFVALGSLAAQDHQQSAQPQDPLRWQARGFDVKFGIETGGQIVGEWNSWWNLAATYASTFPFDPDRYWYEGYLKAGFTGEKKLNNRASFYGGISGMATGNLKRDVFGAGDSGRVLIENGYGGFRYQSGSGYEIDVSGGPQRLRVGNGFLLSNGSANGFERGATVFGPRLAWGITGILRLKLKNLALQGYYLRPNELASSDSFTKIVGGDAQFQIREKQFAGMSYIKVFHSDYPYIAAPIRLIANGRDGLQVINPFLHFNPLPAKLPGLMVTADYAAQWNPRIDMQAWGMNIQVANTFVRARWTPTLGYAFRYYSGDNPATPRVERFDALYYNGGVTEFASGSNGSLAFYNSNVSVNRVQLNLVITPRDLLDVAYYYVRAPELNSPIQFGQGFRLTFNNGVPAIVTGVPYATLSNDAYLGYTRIVNRHLFFTGGVAVSVPGKGLSAIANGTIRTWPGVFGNFVLMY